WTPRSSSPDCCWPPSSAWRGRRSSSTGRGRPGRCATSASRPGLPVRSGPCCPLPSWRSPSPCCRPGWPGGAGSGPSPCSPRSSPGSAPTWRAGGPPTATASASSTRRRPAGRPWRGTPSWRSWRSSSSGSAATTRGRAWSGGWATSAAASGWRSPPAPPASRCSPRRAGCSSSSS
ncbi:MAG: hypothetical protein AVDCRST_MAG49-1816, partial [uncultured Thermomicrobiales bacterium]